MTLSQTTAQTVASKTRKHVGKRDYPTTYLETRCFGELSRTYVYVLARSQHERTTVSPS